MNERPEAMRVEDHRNLQALEAIAEDSRITQRTLSSRLGIALGLTNIYLRRLVRKGYIKCVNVQSNRLRYLLTPKGIAEKTRLTYEFMQYLTVALQPGAPPVEKRARALHERRRLPPGRRLRHRRGG